MNPEFGFGISPEHPDFGTGNLPNPSASVGAIQNSNVLIVTKLDGGIPVQSQMPGFMGNMAQPQPQQGVGMGWNMQMPQSAMPMPMPSMNQPEMLAGAGALPLSQYSIRNQQNVEVARIEPSVSPVPGYVLKGTSGDIIMCFALEMTQSNNTPMVLFRNVSPGVGPVIASLVTEMKQSKEEKHKDKPKKDKKKDKDEHKDKSKDKDKGAKRQYVLKNHVAQPLFRFSGKQKSKEGGRIELKIKSCADKENDGGEVESLGSSAAPGFQVKFKSSHKSSGGASHATDPSSAYHKSFIIASVIGIIELFQPVSL